MDVLFFMLFLRISWGGLRFRNLDFCLLLKLLGYGDCDFKFCQRQKSGN